MENNNNKSTDTTTHKRKNFGATASLFLGALSLMIPYPILAILGFGFLFLSEKIGTDNANLLQARVPFGVSLISLIAILFGIIAFTQETNLGNDSSTSKITAIMGIVLGILTLVFVTVPLWFMAQVAISTGGG